jgi:hypothetical protein
MSSNLGHKMWGESPMTAPGVHRDIRPYEKSARLLVCSPALIFLIFDKTLLSDGGGI